MKLRSFLIALGLGCIFYLTPLIAADLPLSWPLLWLAASTNEASRQVSSRQSNATEATSDLDPNLLQASTGSQARSSTFLLVSKLASSNMIKAGEALTYTIVVTNTGTSAAQKVIIVDELPDGLRFHGQSYISVMNGVKPQLQVSAQRITGTVETLYSTGRIVLIGHTLVEPNATGTTLHNRAVVTATNNENSNNWAEVVIGLITATPTVTPLPTATLTPVPTTPATAAATPTATLSSTPTSIPNQADLQIKKTAAHEPIMGGSLVTYTIQVSNLGPGPARNVLVRDLLPKELFFEGRSSLVVLLGETPKLQLSRNELTATVSLLGVGGLLTITTPVRTPITTINQMLINQAALTADTPDPQSANNNAGAPVVLFPSAISARKNYLPLITR